jgi:hypothetical protein
MSTAIWNLFLFSIHLGVALVVIRWLGWLGKVIGGVYLLVFAGYAAFNLVMVLLGAALLVPRALSRSARKELDTEMSLGWSLGTNAVSCVNAALYAYYALLVARAAGWLR